MMDSGLWQLELGAGLRQMQPGFNSKKQKSKAKKYKIMEASTNWGWSQESMA